MSSPPRQPDIEVPLWPNGVPGGIVGNTDLPRLAVYRAGRNNAPCVLVCPGGGYHRRADHEADPVAIWLNTLGITGIVVHYRVAPYTHPHPLNDLIEAVQVTRRNREAWSVDATRLGVLGFSAGGHLASTLCTLAPVDVRPALAILLYPVITLGGPSTHTGSRKAIIPDASDPTWVNRLSSDQHVTPQTPPAFLFHTVDDAAVPVENALLYAAALRRNGVPFEMHLHERGRHGVGLATDIPELATWPMLCANWLRLRGWTT